MKQGMKKTLGLFAASVMMVSSLSGCSGKSDNAKGNNEASKGNSGPPITLNVEVFDRGVKGQPDLNNNYWTRYVNENFGKPNNIIVNYVPVIRSQEVDKLNVLMAAGQAPDIVFTYDSATVSKYVKDGGVYQLDDLLNKDGKDLKKYLGDSVLSYGKYDGKQMVIPAKRILTAWSNFFIRKDWLDKLGLPVPKNKDELYTDLVAFRDKNPGNVKGVIPWAIGSGGTGVTLGFGDQAFVQKMTDEQFATLDGWVKPGMKDYYKWLNKLYNEKLISPDFALDKTGQQANADISSGKAGFFAADWNFPYLTNYAIYSTLQKNVPGAQLIPVDTFLNPQGKYSKVIYDDYGIFTMIPKSSKHADAAIKYLDWMAKNIFWFQNGQEGVNYKMVDGLPVPIPQTGDNMMISYGNLDYAIIVNGIDTGDMEKNIALTAKGSPGYEDDVMKAYKVSVNDGYKNFYSNIPNEARAKYGKTLSDKTKEMQAKLLTVNPADFDKLYDSLVEEYMNAGGKAVQDEQIKIYEETKKTQK